MKFNIKNKYKIIKNIKHYLINMFYICKKNIMFENNNPEQKKENRYVRNKLSKIKKYALKDTSNLTDQDLEKWKSKLNSSSFDGLDKVVQVNFEQKFNKIEENQGRENIGVYNSDVSLDSLLKKYFVDFEFDNPTNKETILKGDENKIIIPFLFIFEMQCSIVENPPHNFSEFRYSNMDDIKYIAQGYSDIANKSFAIIPDLISHVKNIKGIGIDVVTSSEGNNKITKLSGRMCYTQYEFPNKFKSS